MYSVQSYQKLTSGESIPDLHYLDIFLSIPSVMGAFAFSYRKSIFWPLFWKIYLPCICAWDLWGSLWIIEMSDLSKEFIDGGWIYFLSDYVLLFPLYFMLFRLAFAPKTNNFTE
jgi:hypothetical protein